MKALILRTSHTLLPPVAARNAGWTGQAIPLPSSFTAYMRSTEAGNAGSVAVELPLIPKARWMNS